MHDDPIDNLLRLLSGVKRAGDGWKARCPAHDDKVQSLSVHRGSDGRALIHCHVGCTLESILTVLGITKADLFVREGTKPHEGAFMSNIVETYNYRDESGKLLFQSVRLEPKDFKQRRPGDNGRWEWNLEGVERVLYRLPELIGTDPQQPIFIVEGEKDVDRLIDEGFVATTNPQGAGKWRAEYSKYLADRRIVILPDNDEPGRNHASQVVQNLWGIAKAIKVVHLPGIPPKGDVSDWLDQGHTKEELHALVYSTPRITEENLNNVNGLNQDNTEPVSEEEAAEQGIRCVCMADVQPEEVDWLWNGFMARGKFGLWEGDPGIGKTYALLAAGAAITQGWALPGMEVSEPQNVMLLTMEDDLADTIRPRLDSLGADLNRFYAYDDSLMFDKKGLEDLTFEVARRKPALLIIDPIMAYIPAGVDIYKPNQIRQITTPLRMLAKAMDCAVIGIRHLTKGQKDRAIYRGSGGMDFVGASRLVVLVGMDPDKPGQRAIVQTKTNLGAPPQSVNFTIEQNQFLWAGHTTVSAERILSAHNDDDERSAVDEAVDFLKICLDPFPRKSKEVFAEAKQNGIKEPTLRLAKRKLGVVVSRHGQEGVRGGGVWLWALPGTGIKPEDLHD